MPVGHEEVAVGRHGDIGGAAKMLGVRARHPLLAERQQQLSLRAELVDAVPPLVGRENVPVRGDPEAMSPHHHARTPRFQQRAVGAELEHRRFGAVEGVDVAVVVDRQVGQLAPLEIVRQPRPVLDEAIGRLLRRDRSGLDRDDGEECDDCRQANRS